MPMQTLDPWIPPLINLAILFVCGAIGGVGGIYGAGKAITATSLGDAIFRGGAYGAGAGLLALEKLSHSLAIVIAIFTGGGWLTKEEILARLLSVFKNPNSNGNERRTPPSE